MQCHQNLKHLPQRNKLGRFIRQHRKLLRSRIIVSRYYHFILIPWYLWSPEYVNKRSLTDPVLHTDLSVLSFSLLSTRPSGCTAASPIALWFCKLLSYAFVCVVFIDFSTCFYHCHGITYEVGKWLKLALWFCRLLSYAMCCIYRKMIV